MKIVQQFQDNNILISGGAGFVGSNLTRRLLSLGVRKVHIVDNLLSSERQNIPNDERILFTEASLADDKVLAKLEDEYDYIFHLSTYHGNQSSIHNPLADHENNLLPTLKLLERVKNFHGIKKIVYAGAGCAVAEKTFDSPHATSEDEPINIHMDSPYSISKIVGEFYMVYYYSHAGLPTVRARFQNVYGPGEILGAGKWRGTPATVWRNVIPTFVYKAIKREPLPVEGEGMTSRDFIYVEDIVEGLLYCALLGRPGDVYNLASGVETTIRQLADLINKLTENPTGILWLPKRNWDRSGRRFGDPSKAKEQLGFKAQTDLNDGIIKTIRWTKENLDFIESCIRKHSSYLTQS